MKIKFLILPIAALVLVLAELTQATPFTISDALREVTEIEKVVTDSKFQNAQEQFINNSADPDDKLAKNALEKIKKIAKSVKLPEVASLALDIAIEGIVECRRLASALEHAAKTALDAASKLVKSKKFDEALDVLSKTLRSDRDLTFIAGVPVHDSQGIALAMSGGAAIDGLKKAIVNTQVGGNAVFDSIELVAEIAAGGIKAGGKAADAAIKAAKQTVTSAMRIVDKQLNDAAKNVLESLKNLKAPKADRTLGIVESLKTQISTDNPEALSAIDRLNKNFASTVQLLTKKNVIDAAKVMHQGLVSTILETADAVSVAKKTLAKAGKLTAIDPEEAAIAIRKGMKAAEAEILFGSGPGYLGLGAAGSIAGQDAEKKLVPAVLEIEYGRVSAFEEIALAERVALLGIESGDEAAAEAIEAAQEICDAAGIILYQDYADAGDIGFDALRSL